MATKLGVWNAALAEVGDTRLATLTDDVESRYILDDTYDRVVEICLEAGLWNHAMRNVSISSTSTPAFEFSYQFLKPDDWVRTAALSASSTYQPPLQNYIDQATVWRANVDPIYVKYVSNDTNFGNAILTWPESFTRYVELELAWRIGKRVNQSETMRQILAKDRMDAKSFALAKDAMNEAAPRMTQPGRFVTSRYTTTNIRNDRLTQ